MLFWYISRTEVTKTMIIFENFIFDVNLSFELELKTYKIAKIYKICN